MSLAYMMQIVRANLALVVVVALLMVSSLSVIYTKHNTRIAFVSLQKLEQHRDDLNEEWGRLLLEQSTWATPSRIEQKAAKRLDMISPTANQIVVIKP